MSTVIEILLHNPLTVALAILGVVCIVLGIVGRIPTPPPQPDFSPGQVVAIIAFGFCLLATAVGLAVVVANSERGSTQTTVSGNATQSEAPTATATPLPHWDQTFSPVPQAGTRLDYDLAAGQVLMLAGGQFQFDQTFCGGSSQQICVLVYQATGPQHVTITDLVTAQNWVGISSTFTPDAALQDQTSLFWMPPNCVSGCAKATVVFFKDGSQVGTRSLTRP